MRFKIPEDPLVRAYLACGVLSVLAIWLHRYPAGIDLPQHANLFQILANYFDPRAGYRAFYYLDFYTPYAVSYALAWPFAIVGGGLFATKAVMTIAVLGLPIGLLRWLRAVEGEPWLGLMGYAVAFGFGYQWGFLSFVLSGTISLFYLAAVEEMKKDRRPRKAVLPAVLGILLFFCHGATFSLVMAASGLACLMQRKIRDVAFDLVHFAPIGAVFLPWYFGHQRDAVGGYRDLADAQRLLSLFSGIYSANTTFFTTMAGFLTASALFAVGRPALSFRPARVLPMLIGLVGLFSVPEWVGATWLVGTRFVQFVHLYAAAAFDFRKDEAGRRWLGRTVLSVVVLVLLSVHYRLFVFNRELDGLDRVGKHVPAGSDVHLYVGQHQSEVFGPGEHGQVVAWVPTRQGGFLENDSAAYWLIPVQRRKVPWPVDWPYHVGRGSVSTIRNAAGRGARHLATEGNFQIFTRPVTHIEVPGLRMIRFGQAYAKPNQDRSTTEKALLVGGRTYEHGIGAHAQSILQMRPADGVRRVRGAVGLDEGAPGAGHARFRILDWKRRELWSSKSLTQGEPAVPFEVSLDGVEGDILLVTEPTRGSNSHAHTDWVDLSATP